MANISAARVRELRLLKTMAMSVQGGEHMRALTHSQDDSSMLAAHSSHAQHQLHRRPK